MFHLLETSQTTYFIKFYTSIQNMKSLTIFYRKKTHNTMSLVPITYSKSLTYIIFSMLNCFPFYEWGRQGIKELCNLAKVTHLVCGRDGIWNQGPFISIPILSQVIALKTLVHQSIKVTENAIDGILKNQGNIA